MQGVVGEHGWCAPAPFTLTKTPERNRAITLLRAPFKVLSRAPVTNPHVVPRDGTFIIPVLETWKLRFREVKRLASGLAARRGGAGKPRCSRVRGAQLGAETLTKTTKSPFWFLPAELRVHLSTPNSPGDAGSQPGGAEPGETLGQPSLRAPPPRARPSPRAHPLRVRPLLERPLPERPLPTCPPLPAIPHAPPSLAPPPRALPPSPRVLRLLEIQEPRSEHRGGSIGTQPGAPTTGAGTERGREGRRRGAREQQVGGRRAGAGRGARGARAGAEPSPSSRRRRQIPSRWWWGRGGGAPGQSP